MKQVLIYYSFSFSFGGGEHLPLSLVAALQDRCQVTVALDKASTFEEACRICGIGVDMSKIRIVQVAPPGYESKKHTLYVSLYRSRRLKELARHADICISTGNIMDFGKPAHHFINMLAFGDDDFTAYVMNGFRPVHVGMAAAVKRFLKEKILRPLLGMRSKKRIILDKREHVYPNSRFVEQKMRDFFGPFNSHVFFPPTLFEPGDVTVERDPFKVVYIGRIVPEKRIEELIRIVENARKTTGFPVTFHLAGRVNQTPSYGEKLLKMAEAREWLKFEGPLYGEEKSRFLLSGTYALHAERIEAFGISIAEYLISGNIAIVPDEGGACEIVDNPALAYRTDDMAAAILARLLSDESFRNEQRVRCRERAQAFSREAYLQRQTRLLQEIQAIED